MSDENIFTFDPSEKDQLESREQIINLSWIKITTNSITTDRKKLWDYYKQFYANKSENLEIMYKFLEK